MTLHFFGGSATVPPIFLHLPIVVGQKKFVCVLLMVVAMRHFGFTQKISRKKSFPPMALTVLSRRGGSNHVPSTLTINIDCWHDPSALTSSFDIDCCHDRSTLHCELQHWLSALIVGMAHRHRHCELQHWPLWVSTLTIDIDHQHCQSTLTFNIYHRHWLISLAVWRMYTHIKTSFEVKKKKQ